MIITERNSSTMYYFQVTYEWEDIFSQYLSIELKNNGIYHNNKKLDIIKEILGYPFKFKISKDNWNLAFIMFVRMSYRYKFKNVIPIYLDVHKRWINKIINDTKRLPIFFVTSYDIYKMIQDKINDERCVYIPLSISDKYYNVNKVLNKDIDVVQLGRKNLILHNYMMEYCQQNRNVNYIYMNNGNYVSTTGIKVDKLISRKEYMKLLERAKISLVSSPCVDKEKDFGKGVDFITPRFYESAVEYCHMIGRYTDNDESRKMNLSSVCHNVYKKEEFFKLVDRYLDLSNEANIKLFDDFIKTHITSYIVQTVKKEMQKRGIYMDE